MDDNNRNIPIASINRTVRGASIEDICTVLEHGSRENVESAHRNIATREAIEEIDVGINKIQEIVSFAFVKFLLVTLSFAAVFTLGYYFLGWNPVANVASHGIFGCLFFGLAVGSLFCRLFDLGVIYTIFRRVTKRMRPNLLTDFAKVFGFSQDGEQGSWLTPLQIAQTIQEKTGRKYDTLDTSRFLEEQEYITKKILRARTFYYLKLV